jgi:hypothetical protein
MTATNISNLKYVSIQIINQIILTIIIQSNTLSVYMLTQQLKGEL